MTCVIDTGGGLRGVYGAGVLDRFMDENITFGCCVGVSAGSANVAAYVGGQRGRNYAFYCDYSFRREYMSFGNLLKTGSYIGLDYIYGTLSNEGGEDPLDYDALAAYPGEFFAVATEAASGKPRYFGKDSFKRNDYAVISASCAIPAVCRPHEVGNEKFFDGGVSDPVPLSFALERGADRIILILTRPRDFVMNSSLENKAALLLRPFYPEVSKALKRRAELYREGVELAVKLEKEGRCLIVAPDDCCGVETLTRDAFKLDRLYKKGYDIKKDIIDFVR